MERTIATTTSLQFTLLIGRKAGSQAGGLPVSHKGSPRVCAPEEDKDPRPSTVLAPCLDTQATAALS